MSEGDTPLILDAWPNVDGFILLSFSTKQFAIAAPPGLLPPSLLTISALSVSPSSPALSPNPPPSPSSPRALPAWAS